MPIKPEGYVESDISVKLLARILADTYTDFEAIIKNPATDPITKKGKIKALKQIDDMVAQRKELADAWAEVFTAGHYERGVYETQKSLVSGNSLVESNAFGGKFHQDAVQALTEETYQNINGAMTGISETGAKVIAEASKIAQTQAIGTGITKGQTLRNIKKQLIKEFSKQGIIALKDRAGKQWELNRYTEMLARTKLTQAHNSGVAGRMDEMGYDLVLITDHYGECELCRPFENVVLSVSGRNKQYTSLDDAKAQGLFHPNCRHAMTPYFKRYLDQSTAWNHKTKKYEPFKDRISLKPRKSNVPKSTKLSKVRDTNMIPKDFRNVTLYRGTGGSTYSGATSTLDAYGKAQYYALDRDTAKLFGKNINTSKYKPTNPIIVRNIDELEALQKTRIKAGFDSIADYARDIGADAVIDVENGYLIKP